MKALGVAIVFIFVAVLYVQAATPSDHDADGSSATVASSRILHGGAPITRASSARKSLTAARKRQYWYWTVIPPAAAAETIYVGPYPSRWDCRDMLGSAIYAHPWACHIGLKPTAVTCRIIGNGFAYPADYPYPVPPDMYITGQDCVESDDPGLRRKAGWYFLYYTVDGGGIEACKDKEYKRFKELSAITPGMDLGHYRDWGCPGAPCFSIGWDTACN